MLPVKISGAGEPALVLMHFLGGSAREWDEVRALLDPRFRCVAVDLPGFGDAAQVPGYSVEQMADSVAALLGSLHLGRYVLVGHSFSGKVAAVLARRFEDGAATIHAEQLAGLEALIPEALILVAPSPPSPEPMSEEKRESMLSALGEQTAGDRKNAQTYITKSESRVLPAEVQTRAVDELLRMDRAAWVAWVQRGSREDWAERIGQLALPTLVVAGENDGSLGQEVQRRLVLPHFSAGRLAVVPGSGHLIPMEKPQVLATLIEQFVRALPVPETASVPPAYLDLIASERVSPRTREVLLARLSTPESPRVFDDAARITLRAVLARVLPQPPGSSIDLAARLEAQLATGKGDGWRYAVLPNDLRAYRVGLHALDDLAHKLHQAGFAALEPSQQDALLTAIAHPDEDAPQLSRWFEDLRADATAIYVAHPATLARMGYSGIGVGGAHTPHRGFVQIGIGDREPWEPSAAGEDAL